MKNFIFIVIAIFSFVSCSNANDVDTNKEINKNIEENAKKTLFSNQKENEKKRDIQTSFNISIDSSKYDNNNLSDYQKALFECKTFKEGNKSIIGFVDGKCKTEEIVDDKTVVCNFEKDDLKTVVSFYEKDVSILKTLAGSYNIDFKMDIPEVNVDEDNDDTLFNFKMALPKIKIEKTKTPAEILIEKSCK